MRHTPGGVAVSHRTLTVVGGKEYEGEPQPLTGEGLTDLKDPALTALIESVNTTALAAAAERDALTQQVATITAERDAAAQSLDTVAAAHTEALAAKDTEIAKLNEYINAVADLPKAQEIAKQKEIERLEAEQLAIEQQKAANAAKLAELKPQTQE